MSPNHQDHLGSTSVITDESGDAVYGAVMQLINKLRSTAGRGSDPLLFGYGADYARGCRLVGSSQSAYPVDEESCQVDEKMMQALGVVVVFAANASEIYVAQAAAGVCVKTGFLGSGIALGISACGIRMLESVKDVGYHLFEEGEFPIYQPSFNVLDSACAVGFQ